MADKENQKMGNSALRIFIGCFAATILLLFRHGYVFGSGDQSEMLPYAKYLADNSLYPSDFYIQSIAASVPNERFVFSWLLSLFGDRLNWAVFGLHFSATMLLILGLYRITSLALITEGARWLAALAPVLLLYDVNLGGNELYYNIFVPSYVAQVIGIWVFVYGIKGNAFKFFGLLILMTYIHPLIGLQLWLLLSLSFLIVFLKDEPQKKLAGFFIFNGVYLATAGFFILKIKNSYDGGNISAQSFLDIIAFRVPHHYFPHTFPIKNWLLLFLPVLLGWHLSYSIFRYAFRLIFIGAIVYVIGVYIFKSPTVLSLQWFSTTVWLKTLSFIFTLSLVESYLEKTPFSAKILEPQNVLLKPIVAIGLLSILLMPPQYQLFRQKSYDFPFVKTDNSEVQISKLAKERTPKNALFLIPSNLSEFRFWSERSSFIDYKANNHRQSVFVEWYKRIQDVYHISLADRLQGANLTALANAHFQKLTETDFLEFAKNQHVTHVLTYKNVVLNFPKVADTEGYVIYEILRR